MTAERILVTGATGFTGSHLCDRLVEQGHPVRVLVRRPQQAELWSRMGVEAVVGDLRDASSLVRAASNIDLIYHIAASFRAENVGAAEMWETNVKGTQSLLDAAIQAGVKRFVHCSTVGVHGDIEHPPATERAPYRPGDRYQTSKTDGERLVLTYMHDGRLPIVVFRPGGIYGPRDLRFLKLFKAIQRRQFVMLGKGEVLYQLIYIDDLIDGIMLCGMAPQAAGQVYILTGAAPVTLNQLVETLAGVLGRSLPRWRLPVMPFYVAGALCEWVCKPLGMHPPLYRRRVDFFRKTRSFDIHKARAELGFHPRVDLKTGLRLTAEWYRQEGSL